MTEKEALRRKMRQARRQVDEAARTRVATALTERLVPVVAGATPVAVYLASEEEVDLDPFIAALLAAGRRVVAPRWNGAAYDLAVLNGLSPADLRTGPMGVREPAAATLVRPADVAAWLVPGLAFTCDGRRLGYGGGWYDRLLAAAAPAARRIGVAYGFQMVDDLPCEAHDVRLTDVLFETV